MFFFVLWKREKLQACIETLGDVICYHHGMTSSEQPESSLIHHRMVFSGTAIFTIRLLQTLLPVEKVSEHMAVPFLDINQPCHHRWMDIWPCPSWPLLKQMRVWNTPEVTVKGSIVQLSCRPKDSTVITDKLISVCLFIVHMCVYYLMYDVFTNRLEITFRKVQWLPFSSCVLTHPSVLHTPSSMSQLWRT